MKPSGDIYVAEMTSDGLIFKLAGNGAMLINPKPTFSIPYELAADFRVGIVEALREWGVENETESKIAGKLAATDRHLEDMRRLVFKSPAQRNLDKLLAARDEQIEWLRQDVKIAEARAERLANENMVLQRMFEKKK